MRVAGAPVNGITPRFHDWLDARQIGPFRWQLLHRFRFDSAVLGARIIVAEGEESDFASVPRAPLAYLLAGGWGNGPAVLHDHLYRVKHAGRDVADAVFFEAMVTDGSAVGQCPVPGWRARAMYAGVRVGGWASW